MGYETSGISYPWWRDLALDLGGNEEIKINHSMIILIYEDAL